MAVLQLNCQMRRQAVWELGFQMRRSQPVLLDLQPDVLLLRQAVPLSARRWLLYRPPWRRQLHQTTCAA